MRASKSEKTPMGCFHVFHFDLVHLILTLFDMMISWCIKFSMRELTLTLQNEKRARTDVLITIVNVCVTFLALRVNWQFGVCKHFAHSVGSSVLQTLS